MSDPFTGEPDPFDVTVTASVVGRAIDGIVLSATLENGTEADGGEVELRVPDSATQAYGLEACVAELERFLNSTLRPEFRLDAALAMGASGAFTIVATAVGPRAAAASMGVPDDLAA